jgi:UDP-N-acetylmuramoylalanine--D-glutamate ligase
MELKNKKVTVMGIGLHGGSKNMIKWLLEQGAQVVATDIKKEIELKSTLEELKNFKNLKIVVGHHRPEDFQKTDLVIKNPTVPWDNKYIQIALKNKIPVEMDSSIFMKEVKTSNIIGITGTKGKTTTATLMAKILEDAGKKVFKVGIGQEAVMDKLKKITAKDFVVFEMSSWRLSGLKKAKISPKYSLVTNIHPDHLNHYNSMEDYLEDKKQIYLHQSPEDFVVFNYDNPITKEMSEGASAKRVYFSDNKIPGDRVVFVQEGKIIAKFGEKEEKICEIKKFGLKGAHNLHNILGAVSMAIVLGIEANKIKKSLISFKGVAHRLEFVRSLKGVEFYNDTTATTPDSAIAGVNSFLKPINIIIGGSSKKLDPTDFLKKLVKSRYVKNIFIMESPIAEKIKDELMELGGEFKIKGIFNNFEETIKSAYQEAESGEVVLLSPGFASFGMFENEFDRGRQFKKIAISLK